MSKEKLTKGDQRRFHIPYTRGITRQTLIEEANLVYLDKASTLELINLVTICKTTKSRLEMVRLRC